MPPPIDRLFTRGSNGLMSCQEPDMDWEEPIAVCGMGLKFPQDATSPESFWEMLASKRNAMSDYPTERLNIDGFHHPRSNGLVPRGGNFIREDLSCFDADFFSVTPSEAAAMDPMQRLLLETTFASIENAGFKLEDLRGSRTSVHTGCFSNDYLQQLLKDADTLPPYAAVGASQSMLANRISWFFDLRGPSVNMDSACSSSAMGVDAACQLLRSRRVDTAVVAGCNLTIDPDYSRILSNMQMLSPDARCYAFDHRANGYARGEGVGVIILKRLSNALQDNDTIRAVIRSSGSNQDGRTPGITQPDRKSQAQLIRETYQRAGLSMCHTLFFEAHGTGTPIGDPIEVGAIVDCFQGHRTALSPLYVGSVKTNIGHLEGASGIAGVIKSVIVVESGVIPPNANFERLNPRLAAYSCIAFPQRCVAWPESDIRRVSINSFGYGGSNCHIVLDDAYSYLRRHGLSGNHRTAVVPSGALESSFLTAPHLNSGFTASHKTPGLPNTPKLLVWSANSEVSVKEMLVRWQGYFRRASQHTGTQSLSNVAYTLDSRRSRMAWKAYAVVESASELVDVQQIASKPQTQSTPSQVPRLAFVFTGQGAQWYGMGRELLAYEGFSRVVDEAEGLYRGLGCSWSVREEMLKDENESNIDEADISQSLTAILQIGIVDLLKSFNVVPCAVVGHSMGEIAAGYAAGLLTRQSALLLAYYRGICVMRLSKENAKRGAMLAVGLSADEIKPYLGQLRSQSKCSIVVACVNSPHNVTVSGLESEVQILQQVLLCDNVFVRRLRARVAYHSPEMRYIASDCLRLFSGLKSPTMTADSIPMVSSVTGAPVMRKQACDPSYWVDNMLSPVLFYQAIERLCLNGPSSMQKKLDGSHRDAIVVDRLVEIGPHSALRLPIMEILAVLPRGNELHYDTALVRKESASISLLRLLGNIHASGYPVDIRQVNNPGCTAMAQLSVPLISLADTPSYPFNHSTKYWAESRLSRNYRLRRHGYVELLGSPSWDWNPLAPEWRCCVRPSDMPWLLDHKLNGQAIYPAAAMIVMVLEAVLRLLPHSVEGFTLRKVQFRAAIVVTVGMSDTETRVRLIPTQKSSRWLFAVLSVTGEKWSLNCEGVVEAHLSTGECITPTLSQPQRGYWDARDGTYAYKMIASDVYRTFKDNGFYYGPSFQGIQETYHDGASRATSAICLDRPLCLDPVHLGYVIHPATLDAMFQLTLVTLMSNGACSVPTQAITSIDRLWVTKSGLQPSQNTVSTSAKLESQTGRKKVYSLIGCISNRQTPCIVLEGLQTTIVSSAVAQVTSPGERQFWYTVRTGVDIDMLSSQEIITRLNHLCGPDSPGPRSFSRELLAYMYAQVRSIRECVRIDGIVAKRPHLIKYIEWMDWQLSNSGHLYTPGFDEHASRKIIANQGVLGEFFLQVADSVLDILQGTTDIVQLLFEKNLVESFYEHQSFGSIYYLKLSTYLKDLSLQYPNMQIMEVGAGTGSFTQHVLNGFAPGQEETGLFDTYHYTDISPAFFERARSRFSQHAGKMAFQVFNAETSPLSQGFLPASLDIITASNVLHVTSSLQQTLRALRTLLKPGGKLILHEIVRPDSIPMGFVFGLLSGWWPRDPTNSRPLSPVVTEAAWDLLLRESGFSGTDFVLRDYADEDAHLMSIMCATAVEPSEETQTYVDTSAATIVIEPESPSQQSLASQLANCLTAKGLRNSCRVVSLTGDDMSRVPADSLVITLLDLESPILSRLDGERFESLKRVLGRNNKILWVSSGGGHVVDPRFGLIHGFSRVFRIENPQARMAVLALDTSQPSVGIIESVFRRFHSCDIEDYTVVDGILHFSRIQEDRQLKSTLMAYLSQTRRVLKPLRDAKSFAVETSGSRSQPECSIVEKSTVPVDLAANEVEIDVQFVGYNDSVAAESGYDYAGIITRVGSSSLFEPGDRVCTYAPGQLRSPIRAPCRLVALIPDSIPAAQASTMSQDLLCASYLSRTARISAADVIVIYAGNMRMAHALMCHLRASCLQLFVTASSAQGLEAEFEGVEVLSENRFMESFMQKCPSGADIIIDFTDTDVLDLADGLKMGGQILSINVGSRDYHSSSPIPNNITYRRVDLKEIFRHHFSQLAMPSLPTTHLAPWRPAVSFKLSDLASRSHNTHVIDTHLNTVIEFDKSSPTDVTEQWTPSFSFNPSSSYVISGGLGDLGRCLARWMVKRGARHLILISRSGPHTVAARELAVELESCGATVHMPACDIRDRASLERVLSDPRMPPVRGCIQASAVLKDIMYENMTLEDWHLAIDPKVTGSWNLHSVLPRDMDFFVLTSSITGILGQATQMNYAAANTYQDSLAHYRLSQGEHAISIDLGILLTGGLLSQRQGLVDRLVSTNLYEPISEAEILALFDYICDPAQSGRSSPQIITGIVRPSRAANRAPSPAFQHPSWSLCLALSTPETSNLERSAEEADTHVSLSQSGSVAAAAEIVVHAVAGRFCRTSLTPKEKLDLDAPLHVAGADSLTAVDLRNWILKEFAVDVPVFDILGDSSVHELGLTIALEWKKRLRSSVA